MKPNPIESFALQSTEILDTLSFAENLAMRLMALATAIAKAYSLVGLTPSGAVDQGIRALISLSEGNARLGLVLNAPVLSLSDLVRRAREELGQAQVSASETSDLTLGEKLIAVRENALTQLEPSQQRPSDTEAEMASSLSVVTDLAAWRESHAKTSTPAMDSSDPEIPGPVCA